MPDIHDRITAANLDAFTQLTRGDCISIAAAIHEVFGGQPLVFYLTPAQDEVMHAVVDINDVCYDGHGQRSFDFLLKTATADAQERTTHDNWVDSDLFTYETDLSTHDIYDEPIKEAVVNALRNTADE